MILSTVRNNNRPLKYSPIRLIQFLLFAHLLILTFQIPIRAIFIDTTFLRDFLIIALIGYLFIISTINYGINIKRKLSLLDKFIVGYLLWGMFLTVLWIITGVDSIMAIREFRNHFFPFILFFLAKKSFNSSASLAKLTNIFSFIFLIILINIIIEYILLGILGFSKATLPWYRYVFKTSYYFYGNLVSSEGAMVHPESSPILGIFGWPHSTAIVFLGLFVFVYPLLIEKKHRQILRGYSFLIAKLPLWFSYLILFMTVAILFIVLKVKMQIIVLLILFILGSLILKGKYLVRNLVILTIFSIILFSSKFIYNIMKNLYISAFVRSGHSDSTFQYLIAVNPIDAIFQQPLFNILFGSFHTTISGSEVRLLNYTLKFGIGWLFLFIGIIAIGIKYARKIIHHSPKRSLEYYFSIGTVFLLVSYFLDMGHYARILFAPNIDILAVCLGAISSIIVDQRRRFVQSFS